MLIHCSKPQIFCLKKLNLKKIVKPNLAFLRKNKIQNKNKKKNQKIWLCKICEIEKFNFLTKKIYFWKFTSWENLDTVAVSFNIFFLFFCSFFFRFKGLLTAVRINLWDFLASFVFLDKNACPWNLWKKKIKNWIFG